ncbi:putative FMN-binding domain-containing protein [Dactylonectria estremocensis]|uniref:FMN-binding domain-containing protein n=1 Tax=Dactylonectria estremocensis TaxID=1079267 RepID=A0A9P9JJ35_9HYPO|nr:putative FMN-binding domain-containing protein [Dactylonectria estremocensis]
MHLRSDHAEKDLRVLRKLIRENPLGLMTTAIPSTTYDFLQSSHIPFVLDIEDESSETELGRLRCHMARQNPQSKAMIEHLTANPALGNVVEQDVIIIFTSPVQHYVTSKFYTETKLGSGKVVPTWNYAAAQVYGRARVFFDTKSDETSEYLQKQMEDLSHQSETQIMGFTGGENPVEWKVSDAPSKYVELLKKAIIGVEITITRLEGKFKMSQEMGVGDREGVVKGFAKLDSETGQAMSKLVKERWEIKDAAKAATK